MSPNTIDPNTTSRNITTVAVARVASLRPAASRAATAVAIVKARPTVIPPVLGSVRSKPVTRPVRRTRVAIPAAAAAAAEGE